jgi:hypothetical protein
MPSDGDDRDRSQPAPANAALAVTQPAPKRPGPARHPSDPRIANERVQAALAASTRTEATLSGLMRAVQEVTSGLTGAKEANDQLTCELGSVRDALTSSLEEKTALEVQLASLVVERDHALRELQQAREEAERERSFLIEEQDRFLAALLDEHEQAVAKLRAERDELLARVAAEQRGRERTTAPGVKRPKLEELPTDVASLQQALADARLNIDKLVAERTRSLETLRRLQAQRDEAQQALMAARSREDTETRPAPPPDRATPVYRAAAGAAAAPTARPASTGGGNPDNKRTDPMPRRRAEPAEASRAPFIARSEQPTPPDGQRREANPPAPAADAAKQGHTSSAPPLKRKPDPASMPLGGYSLGSEDVETEHVEGPRFTPFKPPRQ